MECWSTGVLEYWSIGFTRYSSFSNHYSTRECVFQIKNIFIKAKIFSYIRLESASF